MSKHENLQKLCDLGVNVPLFIVYPQNISILRQFINIFPSEQTFAVRSSANVEDGNYKSFAGLFRSFLNINKTDLEMVVDECLRQGTELAQTYDCKLTKEKTNIELNVIVQQMIFSDVSGVLFTKNPTGENNLCVIEAAWGLCEGIVSGQITGDRIMCNISRKEIMSYDVSYQEKRVIPCEAGTTLDDVSYLDKSRIKLLHNQIDKLLKTAERIKFMFGTDVDIEWGFYRGDLYVFQARPITT